MKNELRIGNLVTDKDGEVLEVFNILQSYVRVYIDNELEDLQLSYSDLKPIPLTEDLLLKFGFVKNSTSWTNWRRPNHTKEVRIGFVNKLNYYNGLEIKYVHQLQNLYFALTGEELKVTK